MLFKALILQLCGDEVPIHETALPCMFSKAQVTSLVRADVLSRDNCLLTLTNTEKQMVEINHSDIQ